MRDHTPIKISEFNGLWKRGDVESTPLDHFSDCNNISFIESGFKTRPGLDVYIVDSNDCLNLSNVVRMYTYVRPDRRSLLVLDKDGNIYDTTGPTPCTPILSISKMKDFAMVSIAGRAYITPNDGVTGLKDEFVYVYLGDGNPARKAGGAGPTGSALVLTQPNTGNVEKGIHIVAVVYETNTGFLTKLGPDVFTAINSTGTNDIQVDNIPVSPDSFVIARHIVATKAIDPNYYTGNLEGYQFFFVPNGRIPDNTTTTWNINFYDADLLKDAWHLLDILPEIPAGVNITTYHGRMIVLGFYGEDNVDPLLDTSGDISLARVSYAGEPEAMDAVSGLIIAPLDGLPLTNAQEYRDVLYLFKQTRTYAYNDNGSDPSSWPLTVLDQGIGASVHGISTVLDSGGISVDYLIIAGYAGIFMFNGGYLKPELSWKIADYWKELDRDLFSNVQIVNNTINQIFYSTLPNGKLLIGDYSKSLTPKDIKWSIWTSDITFSTIAMEVNKVIVGSLQQFGG